MDNKEGIVQEPHDAPDIKAVAGIRSRITVVCAECKRLKLKCDRRSPCSSCVKRETTARCVYSAAAAEKIDVQSLHNRVSALEDSWRAWTNTQPGQTPALPPPNGSLPPPPPPSQPPSALVATNGTGDDITSALVGLDDVSSLWAAHLGLNLSALSLRPSTPDDSDDEDTTDALDHARQIPISSRTGVTPAHIALLPSRAVRSHLWNTAEKVLGPHAALSRRTRTRFERMCSTLEAGLTTKKWSTSLLAVGTAGLAIGAQIASDSGLSTPSPASSSSSPPTTPCHKALATLSHRALSPSAHDTDAVLAALLHAAQGTLDGRARVRPRVWPDVCRAVGVARGMGLGVDIPKKVADDEGDVAEWRRRVWWEVYCADLFTSDYIGLPPSIDDSTFSIPLPKDPEDEDSTDKDKEKENDALAYFVLKCRLAQLIKMLKRRLLDERPLPFEGANAMERAVSEFMHDLPPAWKLDMSGAAPGMNGTGPGAMNGTGTGTGGPAPGVMGLGDEETALVLQRCELAAAANSLILKAYYPFLKRSASESTPAPTAFASPHHAALACSSAAHALIHASLTAHRLLPRTRPYSFAQQLFGGAVVAASVAITSPTGLIAQMALQDVRGALGVLKELDMWGSVLVGVEGVASEAVRVVEVLVSKAESAMGVGASSANGLKRKRRETDTGESDLGVGFELPFVGASVVTCAPNEEERESVPKEMAPPPVPPPSALPQVEPRRERAGGESDAHPKRERESKPPKVSPYPRIGVRVRNNKAAKTGTTPTTAGPVRSRAGSSVGDRGSAGTSPVTGVSPQATGPAPAQQPQPGTPAQQSQPGMLPPSNGLQPPTPIPSQPGTLPQAPMVPHQPPLQVITEQPTPYMGGTSEYAYNDTYGQMPYLMNTPATPVRNDYPLYGGYDYGMVGDYKEGMNLRENMGGDMAGMGDGAMGVQDGVGDVGQQQGWYRHAPAGPSQTQQGQWSGTFEMPSWGAPPGNR